MHKSCWPSLWGSGPPPAMGFPHLPPTPCIAFLSLPRSHLGATLFTHNLATWDSTYTQQSQCHPTLCQEVFCHHGGSAGDPSPTFPLPPLLLTPADGCQQVAPGIAHGHQRDLRLPGLHSGGWRRCRVCRRGGDSGGPWRWRWGCHRGSHGAGLRRGSGVGAGGRGGRRGCVGRGGG